jgi:hypothetical protein
MNGDERVIILLTEIKDSLEREMAALRLEVESTHTHIDTLAAVVDQHERQQQRLRRTMRAAFEAWLAENGDEG